MKTLPTHLAEDFQREAALMAQCKYPHVVGLYGVCMGGGHYAMVMEYLPKGSLYHVLHDTKESLPWNPLRWNIAIDIGKGLTYLHSQKIIHRDLKSLNVLLDANYQAKISDFGLAKIKLESNSTSTKAQKGMGTTRWRSPELFKRGASPNNASDVYSYGMLLWEIASRQLPFNDALDEQTVISWIKDGEQEKLPADCPPGYGSLVQDCWKAAEQRPSAQAVLSGLTQAKPQAIETAKATPKPKVYEEKAWHFDPETKAQRVADADVYKLVDATDKDKRKVLQFYQHHPAPGYEIASVRVIYNPSMNQKFALYLAELQQCHNNPAFEAKWSKGREKPQDALESQDKIDWRTKIHQQFKNLARPYQDSDHPFVNLLPM